MLDTPNLKSEAPPARHDDRAPPAKAASDNPSPSNHPCDDAKAAAPSGGDETEKQHDASVPPPNAGKDAKAGEPSPADDVAGIKEIETAALGVPDDASPDPAQSVAVPAAVVAPAAPVAAVVQPGGEIAAVQSSGDVPATADGALTGAAAPAIATPRNADAAKLDKTPGVDATTAETAQGSQSASQAEPKSQAADGSVALPDPKTPPMVVKPEHVALDAHNTTTPQAHVVAAPLRLGRAIVEPLGSTGDASVKAADSMQNLGLALPASPANTVANLAHQTPADNAVPLAGMAVTIAHEAPTGKNRFEIRLDPPELGRVDVRLDIDRHGNVSSRLVVERPETLDLLKRDASQLEHALQQAGLKTADNALEFSLRGQAFSRDPEAPQTVAHLIIPEDDAAPLEWRHGYGRLLGLGSGIDIRV